MPTIEEVRAKIRKNFPQVEGQDRPVTWDRETATSIVSSCGRFRISKVKNGEKYEYSAYTTPSPTEAARKIAGPFESPKRCRDAVDDYLQGQPMQQDLK